MGGAYNGAVQTVWGSGPRLFRLTLGGIEELQDKAGCGPAALFARLASGQWLARDAFEVIRLGLIGGGMDPIAAHAEASRYCFPNRPLMEAVPVAQIILGAALAGVADDQPGNSEAADATSAPPAATDFGASPSSTASAAA